MSQQNNQDLIIATNPKSAFAEAIKAIKTNILFSGVANKTKVISITSPEPGDGKSFVVANLALAFANDDKHVLIIDSDLRRGRQHQIFRVGNDPRSGYSNLILNYQDAQSKEHRRDLLNSAIRQTDYINLHLLPIGPTPPNPLELLSSENNRHIINDLRKQYDYIIIDCPPVLGLSDAVVISRLCDVNLVTISSHKTKLDQLDFIKKSYEKVGSTIFGVIINKAKIKHSSYSYYSSNKYYSEDR